LALFGHGAMSELSPLSGVKRKLDFGAVWSAFDQTRTSLTCFAPRNDPSGMLDYAATMSGAEPRGRP
jgi:hypothetical protein